MPTFQPLTLSESERADLLAFVHRGKASARILTRARILLKAGEGWRDREIIAAFDVSRETVSRVRARFANRGLDGVLTDKRQTHRRRALSDEQATHLIALACTAAPEGHGHWTLRLLAGKAVALGYVERISPETIRAVLKPSSKKRAQALAAAGVVYSRAEFGVRPADGGPPRPVRPARRPRLPASLPGREARHPARGDTRAAARGAGAARTP